MSKGEKDEKGDTIDERAMGGERVESQVQREVTQSNEKEEAIPELDSELERKLSKVLAYLHEESVTKSEYIKEKHERYLRKNPERIKNLEQRMKDEDFEVNSYLMERADEASKRIEKEIREIKNRMGIKKPPKPSRNEVKDEALNQASFLENKVYQLLGFVYKKFQNKYGEKLLENYGTEARRKLKKEREKYQKSTTGKKNKGRDMKKIWEKKERLADEVDELREESNKLYNHFSELKSRKDEYKSEIKKKEKDREKLETSPEDHQQQIITINSEIDKLKREKERARYEMRKINSKYKTKGKIIFNKINSLEMLMNIDQCGEISQTGNEKYLRSELETLKVAKQTIEVEKEYQKKMEKQEGKNYKGGTDTLVDEVKSITDKPRYSSSTQNFVDKMESMKEKGNEKEDHEMEKEMEDFHDAINTSFY